MQQKQSLREMNSTKCMYYQRRENSGLVNTYRFRDSSMLKKNGYTIPFPTYPHISSIWLS